MEIGFARLDPVDEFRIEGATPNEGEINRQTYPEVRTHRRIHRNQCNFQRIVQIGLVLHGAVEDWLAVFVLADLQIGRVEAAFDEVSGCVNHKKS